MDYKQLTIANLAFAAVSTADLIYFLHFTLSRPTIWTTINIQILVMISGHIGYSLSFAYFYYHLPEGSHHYETALPVRIWYTIGFLFLSLIACTYLNHSWMRAKLILFYKSKTYFKLFDTIVKFLSAFIFLPAIFQGLRLIAEGTDELDFYAIIAQEVGGIGIFVFDCFILYVFARYFILENASKEPDYEKYLIATHGMVASMGILFIVLSNAVFVYFDIMEERHTANLFEIIAASLFQIPIWAFISLKVQLRGHRESIVPKPRLLLQRNNDVVSLEMLSM